MKIGIDLGGSHIGIGVVNENGVIIEKVEKRLTSVEKSDIEKSIEEYIAENVENFKYKYEITNIGMSIPGTLNEITIIKSVNLELENYNLVDKLKKKIDIPIKIKKFSENT